MPMIVPYPAKLIANIFFLTSGVMVIKLQNINIVVL